MGPTGVSLIISTGNWPEALHAVLASVARQNTLPTEVILADDGSNSATPMVFESWRKHLGCSLRYVLAEDTRQLAHARNAAIAACRGEYVIIIDGDMALHRRFIEDHVACARASHFIQGARALLSPNLTARILGSSNPTVRLLDIGVESRVDGLRSPLLSRFISKAKASVSGIKASNQSFWREHLIRVNGFDERFTSPGFEHSELAARMLHIGVERYDVRHLAIAFHLQSDTQLITGDHPNRQLLLETLRMRRERCTQGIDGHTTSKVAETG
jgi:glycosyltransferase involved in cell wall biosynthesis